MTKAEMVVAMREGKKIRHPVMDDGEWWTLTKVDGVECMVKPIPDWYWLQHWPQDGWEIESNARI